MTSETNKNTGDQKDDGQEGRILLDLAFYHDTDFNDHEAAQDGDDHILRRVNAQIIAGEGGKDDHGTAEAVERFSLSAAPLRQGSERGRRELRVAAGKGVAGGGAQRRFRRYDPGIADPWTIYTGSQFEQVVSQKTEHCIDDDPRAGLAVDPPVDHDAEHAGADGRKM